MKILLVDDDPRLRDLVRLAFERASFDVVTAGDGKAALVHAARENPDLIILDVGLPEMDGFEICRTLRRTSDVPVLFLTARDDEIDRVLGLELGGDDYVTKPFSPRELVARARVILKRSNGAMRTGPMSRGNLELDPQTRLCRFKDEEIALTGTEFHILHELLKQPDRLISRVEIINAIWGARSQVSDRTLDSHLRNLRAKLTQAGCIDAIETVHGQGMRLGPCI